MPPKNTKPSSEITERRFSDSNMSPRNSTNPDDQATSTGYSTREERTTYDEETQESRAQQAPLSEEVDPELEAFFKKYGEINISYIEPPPHSPWFTRPYALNYFHKGTLYRTRHERTSGKLELFLDLVYVGIAANLASNAVSGADGVSFLKFLLVFIPPWTIWSDLKDFMNYYFNDDIIQRGYVLWILALLITYDNNCEFVDDLEDNTAILTCVVTYFLARVTLSGLLWFYSLYIHEHRTQMRLYGTSLVITSSCWFFILLVKTNWGKCIFAALMFIVEQTIFCLSVHPWTKKKLGLEYSTALNIEHEDERFQGFVIIAIGEFLYSLVADSPLKFGWNGKLAKGFALLIDAFIFLGIYLHKDGCLKATHALRRSAFTAILYIYLHFPLIASLLIVGDAGVDLSKIKNDYIEGEEELGVLFFFHTGILVALVSLTCLASLDQDRDDHSDHYVPRFGRISFRIPIGILIFGLTWAHDKLTIVQILWMDCVFLTLLYFFEFTVMNPFNFNIKSHMGLVNVQEA